MSSTKYEGSNYPTHFLKVGVVLLRIIFSKAELKINVKVKVTQNGMHYSVIPRGIYTPNLGFLTQIIYRLYASDPIILETRS